MNQQVLIGIMWYIPCFKAEMYLYIILKFQSFCFHPHFTPDESFKNMQTLGQFFEPLYYRVICNAIQAGHSSFLHHLGQRQCIQYTRPLFNVGSVGGLGKIETPVANICFIRVVRKRSTWQVNLNQSKFQCSQGESGEWLLRRTWCGACYIEDSW